MAEKLGWKSGGAQQSSSALRPGVSERRQQAAAAASSGGGSGRGSGSGMKAGFLGGNPRTLQTDAVSTPAALQMQMQELQVGRTSPQPSPNPA